MPIQPIARPPTPRLTNIHRALRAATAAAVVGVAAAGVLVVPPRVVAEGAREPHESRDCSVATLKGRYPFSGTGTLLPPAFGVTRPALASTAGTHLFNGDGTGTDIVTFRIDGVTVLENAVVPITYTVDDDCTGAYAVPNGPSFGMFVAPTGDELTIIATDPGDVAVFGPSRRVARR